MRSWRALSTPPYLEKIKDTLRHSDRKLPAPSLLKVSTIKVSSRIIAAPKLVGEKVVAAPVVTEEEAATAEPAKGGKDVGKGAAPATKIDDEKGGAHAKCGRE
jgi:large subunit ribosomal protein L10e